jgi:hypothetical protein
MADEDSAHEEEAALKALAAAMAAPSSVVLKTLGDTFADQIRMHREGASGAEPGAVGQRDASGTGPQRSAWQWPLVVPGAMLNGDPTVAPKGPARDLASAGSGRSPMAGDVYRIGFLIAGGIELTTELTVDDVDALGLAAIDLPADHAEARQRIMRTRLALLAELTDQHLVVNTADGREWIVPSRSVLAAWFTEPGGRRHAMGFVALPVASRAGEP